jgi:hypothetical protein
MVLNKQPNTTVARLSEGKGMTKRSAYEADADYDDMPAKRRKGWGKHAGNKWVRNLPWHTFKDGLRRYCQNRFPSIQPRLLDGAIRVTFDSRLVRITWTLETHFMRPEKQVRQIFMLLVVMQHLKLSIPFDVLELIINLVVMSGVRTCDRCKLSPWSQFCMTCFNESNVCIDGNALARYL